MYMGLFDDISDILQNDVAPIVRDFETTVPSVTATAKSDQVRQWIEDKICGNTERSIVGLTPTIAPEVPFVKASGDIKLGIAFDGFWRRVSVEIANFGAEEEGRQRKKSPYELSITVEVSYPDAMSTKQGSNVYSIPSLKSEDDELIDGLLRAEGFFSGLLGGEAAVKSLEAAFDIGNTVRRHRYVARVVRTFP